MTTNTLTVWDVLLVVLAIYGTYLRSEVSRLKRELQKRALDNERGT